MAGDWSARRCRESGGNAQAESVATDGVAVEELGIGPHRGDRGHLVNDDLIGSFVTQHGNQGKRRVVLSSFIRGRATALRDQIEIGTVRASVDHEVTVGVGLGLSQLTRRFGARRP
jgi:hypothetical protein